MKKFLLTFVLLSSLVAFGQQAGVYLPGVVQLPVITTVTNTGATGSTKYCYWVVAIYAGGKSNPAGPVCTNTANATLSTTNYNVISFLAPTSPVSAPTGYDILRTTTENPPSGNCACAVATAQSGSPINDQANSLNAYTTNAISGGATMFYDIVSSTLPSIKTTQTGTNALGTVVLSAQKTIVVGPVAAAGCVSMGIPIDAGAYVLAGVREVHTTASSTGTIMVERLTATTAPGSGTNQLTGTISNAGAANTVLAGTVVASPATYVAGDRIGIVCGGTQTGLVGMFVTITLNQVQ